MLSWIVGVFLVLWLVVWGYVMFNKKSLVGRVNSLLTSRVKGVIKIGDLEPSLISTFPRVSLRLSNVIVRDTMWEQHRHDLLKAENIYVRLAFLSLFTGNPEVTKVIIENGSMYVFNDTTGYTNEYMFKSGNQSAGTKASGFSLPDLDLRKMRIVLDLKERNKLYDFDISRLRANVKSRGQELQMDIRTEMIVHNLAFNIRNGSFLKEKPLKGKFRVNLNKNSKKLTFKNAVLLLDDQPFAFSGSFDLDSKPPLYYLTIKADKVNYRRVSALLSKNISRKLDSFDIRKPFSVSAVIDGATLPNKIPLVNINVAVKNNTLNTPLGEFTNASLAARFSNQLVPEENRVDKNSGFTFTNFSGNWEGILLRSDTTRITDLKHPVVSCDIHSSFKLKEANDLLGSSTLAFLKGTCRLDIRYKGSILKGDTTPVSLNGNLTLQDADVNYTPRNLIFTNCSGSLAFDNVDVYVKDLKAQVGKTSLLMNGGVKNLTSLIDHSPEKLVLNWKIASPKVYLGDFLTYLGRRPVAISQNSAKRRFLKLANQVDRLLKDCNVNLQLNADALEYNKFEASSVDANLQLTERMVLLNSVNVQHAGGTFSLNGSLLEDASYNLIKVNAELQHVNVSKIFTSFNNFGQDGITDKNLEGLLSAKINLTGAITDKAVVVENSLKGIVDLQLKNGELNNFEPVENISKTAFKSRDFSKIRFAELKEKLEINGSEIKVNRMEIQSSVITMFVEGIYDVKKGTDLSIQVPLSNLSKDKDEYDLKNKGVKSKTGVSLRLRARTGEDGKAKISWDPFNRALKNKDTSLTDSTQKPIRRNSLRVKRKE